jgi:predicted CoA-binding protein
VSSHHLEYLLAPESLAVIGASDRPGSVGATVMRNVLSGGFRGPVWPVNLRHDVVAGLRAYGSSGSSAGKACMVDLRKKSCRGRGRRQHCPRRGTVR